MSRTTGGLCTEQNNSQRRNPNSDYPLAIGVGGGEMYRKALVSLLYAPTISKDTERSLSLS